MNRTFSDQTLVKAVKDEKYSEIRRETEKLFSYLELLRERLDELGERLYPILKEIPTTGSDIEEQKNPLCTPYAREIEMARINLSDEIRRIENLLERLDFHG